MRDKIEIEDELSRRKLLLERQRGNLYPLIKNLSYINALEWVLNEKKAQDNEDFEYEETTQEEEIIT